MTPKEIKKSIERTKRYMILELGTHYIVFDRKLREQIGGDCYIRKEAQKLVDLLVKFDEGLIEN